jgi:hypothetical protein
MLITAAQFIAGMTAGRFAKPFELAFALELVALALNGMPIVNVRTKAVIRHASDRLLVGRFGRLVFRKARDAASMPRVAHPVGKSTGIFVSCRCRRLMRTLSPLLEMGTLRTHRKRPRCARSNIGGKLAGKKERDR